MANKSAKAKKPDPKPASARPAAKAATPRPGAKSAAKPVAKKDVKSKETKPAQKGAAPAAKAPDKKASAPKPAPARKPEPPKAAPRARKEEPRAAQARPVAKPVPARTPAAAPAAAKKPHSKEVDKKAAPVKAAPAKAPAAAKEAPAPKPAKAPKTAKSPKAPKVSAKEAPATGLGKSGASAKSGPLGKAQAAAVVKAAKALAASRGNVPVKVVVADVKPVAVKKPLKAFFQEVQTGAERIIKRGDKTAATVAPVDIQARRKGGGEESPEELVERIERELEHQHIFKRNVLRPQLCTKCGINVVSERFTIDKELGYCDDCAEILHLGETKEARKIDFHPSLMKKDGEGGAEGPEAAAEEDEDEDEDEDGPPAGKAAVEPD